MRLAVVWSGVVVVLLWIGLGSAACTSADGEGGSGGSGFDKTGSCQSTCEKAVALGCPDETFHDVASCVQSCNQQQQLCASQPRIFQTYLDCVESTPMECGAATGTASSPSCLQEGLAILACVLGGGGSGGDDGGGGAGSFDVDVLASDFGNAVSIDVSAGTVYVADAAPGAGKIVRVTADGTSTPIAENLEDPQNVLVDETSIYWTQGGFPDRFSVMRMPIAGGTPEPIAAGRRNIQQLAVLGDDIFWIEYGGDENLRTIVVSAPKAGGAEPEKLGEHAADAFRLLPTTEGVYFSVQSVGVLRVPLAGGEAVTVTDLANWGLAADDTHVYSTASFGSEVYRIPRAGGAAEPIVTGGLDINEHPYDIAVDATHAWFVGSLGQRTRILRVPKAGTTAVDTGATVTIYTFGDVELDGGKAYTLDQAAPGRVLVITPR